MARTADYFSCLCIISQVLLLLQSSFQVMGPGATVNSIIAAMRSDQSTKTRGDVIISHFQDVFKWRFLYESHRRFIITHLLYLLESWQFVHSIWPITADSYNPMHLLNARKRNATAAKRGKMWQSQVTIGFALAHDWLKHVCFDWCQYNAKQVFLNQYISILSADEPERPKPPNVKIATNWKLEQLQWQWTTFQATRRRYNLVKLKD